jgi:hypothetical protein
MAEYVTCPTCGSKVLTADTFLGRHVRCISCGDRFVATADAPVPPPALPSLDDVRPAPPRFTADEEDDEPDWPYCPGCGRQVSWEESACPHCGEEFEEEDAPRPARNIEADVPDVTLAIRRDGEPHRGRLLFWLGSFAAAIGAASACTFGYLSVVSVPLGVIVWILASRDLKRMEDGSVDPRGRNLTRNARSSAIAGVLFGVLFAGVYLLFW